MAGDPASRIIGYAPGVFDLFHVGHLNLLRQARSHCDHLVAGVFVDEVAARKGNPPVVPLHERLEIVRSVKYVDEAVADATPGMMEAWRQIGFHRLFTGEDSQGTSDGAQWQREVGGVGVEVVYLPYTTDVSSTTLRRKLQLLLGPDETP
ncbi:MULTISPECIES: adenylyltransferase/cytidyltransferase family protein [unclassified Streptomyces]|uniref:adenylyltransferase/cytidyltransferase family protein n=1 Tax=unclassified Streptomyces TaxID=2593676 RepID=UPI001BEC1132|nr:MULTISPECIES: adenylyltransferase/cytidyltransferase family protein [unclassified Streptomyces]MBT2408526.1 adenylyltransferase/cytidyltransferase family protein [Streptomyces sp. ISL-21]MBT2459693.1 adenylyltransferase/cytidyltransferase family protein [Streptomyces sp. ISL-86]MBT2611963.1 adenylyltransferase/cytidyltransferase family protein [Streptomyces sp. ISL-87]